MIFKYTNTSAKTKLRNKSYDVKIDSSVSFDQALTKNRTQNLK